MSAAELTKATPTHGARAQDKSLSPETVVIGVVDPAATASLGGSVNVMRVTSSWTLYVAFVDGQDGR